MSGFIGHFWILAFLFFLGLKLEGWQLGSGRLLAIVCMFAQVCTISPAPPFDLVSPHSWSLMDSHSLKCSYSLIYALSGRRRRKQRKIEPTISYGYFSWFWGVSDYFLNLLLSCSPAVYNGIYTVILYISGSFCQRLNNLKWSISSEDHSETIHVGLGKFRNLFLAACNSLSLKVF